MQTVNPDGINITSPLSLFQIEFPFHVSHTKCKKCGAPHRI